MRRGAPAGRSRGQAVPGRGKGRVGRGLNEAAEALLGMCIEAEEETPQVCSFSEVSLQIDKSSGNIAIKLEIS